MYQNDPLMVLTGEIRCSYVNVEKPRANIASDGTQQGEPRYSVTLLIPKSDVATYQEMQNAMMAAYEEAVKNRWGGARPQLRDVIHDGDGVRESGEPYGAECKGHWVVTAASKRKPDVKQITLVSTAGGAVQRLVDVPANNIYSGMYARVTVRFFSYTMATRKGVGCGLGNILKTRDGEPLSGGTTAEQDFSSLLNQGAQAASPQIPGSNPYAAAPQQYAQTGYSPYGQPAGYSPYAQPQVQVTAEGPSPV